MSTEFQNITMVHTLRIEMLDNSVLLYRITEDEKQSLQKWMNYRTDQFHEATDTFIIFYSLPDRYVFVRIKDIARLIFCWDATSGPVSYEYIDNFEVLPKPDGSLKVSEDHDLTLDDYVPDAIIKLAGKKEPLVFNDLDENNECNLLLDEESFTPNFVNSGYIHLPDEDGEDNYIPVINVSCIEAKRCFVIPDQIWEEIQEKPKKKSKNRKKKSD